MFQNLTKIKLVSLLFLVFLFNTIIKPVVAMDTQTFERLKRISEENNQEEIKERTDYYNYLKNKGDTQETIEEFIARFASLSHFGTPVTEDILDDFKTSIPFPADLRAFYLKLGSFDGGDRLSSLRVYDLRTLSSKTSTQKGYERFHSLGLIDMIKYRWGNDRPEFDLQNPSAIINAQEYKVLNESYVVVGDWSDRSWNDEAHYYIYYDSSGRFGILHAHQDTWKIFHLLDNSEAAYSWNEVMNLALDRIISERVETSNGDE